MNFSQILQIVNLLPVVIQTVENLRGIKLSGAAKKESVRSAVISSATIADALTKFNVKDRKKFDKGLDQVIDGVVQMLNSSEWKKA